MLTVLAAALAALPLVFTATSASAASPSGGNGWQAKTPPLSTPWTSQAGPNNALGLHSSMLATRPAATSGPTGSYVNPVSDSAVAEFPDPSMIRGKDGYWYAYASSSTARANVGDTSIHLLPMMRSVDMVHWHYLGDVFTGATLPAWLAGRIAPGGLWAPDIRYLDGKYYLYYAAAHPPPGAGDFFTVGVATAPSPTGPWTDSGGPVIPPKGACATFTDIDPAQFDGLDGAHYLLWGSFTHLCVMRLNDDATRTVGAVHTVYAGDAEGSYMIEHSGWYYLFVSENDCCKGIYSSYQVRVGRSRSPFGPFVDSRGIGMTDPQSRGDFVIASNGNRWVAPGGLGVNTDLSGQDWLVYHAIPRDRPAPAGVDPNTYRPMLIDRLDWIDGWPTVRGGAWASEDAQSAPVTTTAVGGAFTTADALHAQWDSSGSFTDWHLVPDAQAGTALTASDTAGQPRFLVTHRRATGDQHAEADLRTGADGAVGLVTGWRSPSEHVVTWLDGRTETLRTQVVQAGRVAVERTDPLPHGFDPTTWHSLVVESTQHAVSVRLSAARQNDPVLVQSVAVPPGIPAGGAVGVAVQGSGMAAANVGTDPLAIGGIAVPQLRPGRPDPAYSDSFTSGVMPGTTPGSPWHWVRGPVGSMTDRGLSLPTQGDIWAASNDAPLLLRDAPSGDYTVETELDFDGSVPHQQAGLVVYLDDDHWIRLTNGVTTAEAPGGPFRHELEFSHEYTPSVNCTCWMDAGPTASTMWLRLYHRTDPASGDGLWQAQSSRDGITWVTAGTWWFPADAGTPQIGIAALSAPGATATFHYFRVYDGAPG
jgi:beta-xylosidase